MALSNTDLELIIRGMNSNPTRPIKSLELHDIKLLSQGIKPITSYLSEINPSNFKELHLSFIENLDGNDLGLMMSTNTNLEKLVIRSCFFNDNLMLNNLYKH